MKKLGFFFFIALCFGIAVNIAAAPYYEDKVKEQNIVVDVKKDEEKAIKMKKIEIAKKQIFEGNLLLVNNEYPVLQESVKLDIVNLYTHKELTDGYGLMNTEIYLSTAVANNFSDMIAAANKEGVSHFIISSGYRGFDEQNSLYEELGSDFALPAGSSEHNLGLSLDVGSTQMKMSEAPEGKWLEQNAWKYGFIVRYPKDKIDITGIQYEPWHIRYVGLPHSAIMEEKNLALEEYIDYLKEEKNIFANVNGDQYTVSYYPVPQTSEIQVPIDKQYDISGNNIDGVIVTVYEKM
ncbi:VanY-A/VanY-F/VanY-M family D-Ala-D-Ala carboxypeptidase [Cytobacillus sp. IB215316]|uniref:VanY-A/VanY-F/VanY-M family D-Ala-D-Ala carboxypeptidase n=1 Tax=Cytobacillus sp. IB215316 TaxID=3097354 RepID=UPI002A0E1FF6|nr:VanY-A/VanY-F/VanY-M family D-Ala-D-Ala carboxypeptidase [Cytobacillus sp. IB215316]MDX8361584.1 VanY-A/VanY-F/VanY-M family D-Ala-D-Ala carboxypeptidase [Cytobacillus sp. IB215316]